LPVLKNGRLFSDLDADAGAGIAADAVAAPPDRERAEAAQLDPVAARQRSRNLAKDRRDDDLGITLIRCGRLSASRWTSSDFTIAVAAPWPFAGLLPCGWCRQASRLLSDG
jgi:hypothetical protein